MTEPGPPATAGWWAKVTLEYDGTRFAGSQYQPARRTVQGVVEEALTRLTGEWTRIALAGRTDAGVHALGQVASFVAPARFPPAGLQRGLNALLPEDVAVVETERVAAGFHARFSAVARRYAYQIWNSPSPSPLRRPTSWLVRAPLEVEAMHRAGRALIGTHDFASFAGAGRGVPDGGGETAGTRRTITGLAVMVAEEARAGRLVRIELEAPSFLPHMVRNIAGALVEVGRGRWPEEMIGTVLAAADRRRSAPTAPPNGVILERITYPATWYDLAGDDDEEREAPPRRRTSTNDDAPAARRSSER